jgi:hypothetical protein
MGKAPDVRLAAVCVGAYLQRRSVVLKIGEGREARWRLA